MKIMEDNNITSNLIKIQQVENKLNRPLWSVIIPTHNCAHFLKENIASILAQDPGKDKMEIIVIDDCSTKDDPKAVVERLGKGRIRFHQQVKNVGKVRNYETGLQMSRGQLIHILHGDDLVRQGFYKEMEHLFNDFPNIKAGFCRTIYIDERSRWKGMTGMIQNEDGIVPDIAERLYVQQQIQTPSMVVKRDVYETIGAFDRRLNCMEDWEMWIRIATRYPIAVSNEVLAEYRSHDSNATNLTFLDGSALETHQMVFDIVDGYIPNETKTKFSKTRDRKQAEFLILSYQSRKSILSRSDRILFIKSVMALNPSLYNLVRMVK
jgi:glycosyltransferase involved in cell wall biosynthesis